MTSTISKTLRALRDAELIATPERRFAESRQHRDSAISPIEACSE